jgi:hypothetical protein
MTKSNDARQVRVPVCLTGLISKADVSFCMDEATHVLRNVGVHTRLKAQNRAVQDQLEKAEGKRMNFTACGYLVRGPECDYLSTYSLEPATALIDRLEGLKAGMALFALDGEGGENPHPEPGPDHRLSHTHHLNLIPPNHILSRAQGLAKVGKDSAISFVTIDNRVAEVPRSFLNCRRFTDLP